MSVENIYTSIGCNRTPESADWGKNGLIVFGACNSVALYDPMFKGYSAKITHTYVEHTKRVNTVRWLKSFQKDEEIYCLSGADDKLAILWNIENPSDVKYFKLKGHESGVNAVDGLQRSNGEWLLATTAADSTIKLWSFTQNNENPICKQTLPLNTGFCFTLRLALLHQSDQVLLAFSTDDECVALWAEDVTQQHHNEFQFQLVHKLVGHEDWVRGLDFVGEKEDLLLASSSQDNFIRLWRIAPRTEEQVLNNKVDEFNLLDESIRKIRVEEKILQLTEMSWYAISLESVLYGHDNWVYGVNWNKSSEQSLSLLSSSIDKTLIIWEHSEESGIWMEKVRLGEVGGNSLGFFGGKFSSDGKSVLGHSYQGGIHVWKQSEDNKSLWLPQVINSGHFGEVRDLAWEPQGEYVMSVSADQTTRIHAPWRNNSDETWHELARPQVHGYDMQALALLSRYKFASGAEEKIVRTFQASVNFVENFRRITKVKDDKEGNQLLDTLPKGASVPSLGLSNKAVYTEENIPIEERHVKDEYPENYFTPITLDTPPQEETLMQNTLWPEVQKLYGHGYEIYSLASSPDAALLASSCKSTNAEHAQIILWNTSTWKQIQKLPGHQLTVTQMCFSPDGQYLLSVSRDRRWSLFKRQTLDKENNKLPSFALTACTDKTNGVHTRIIWSCDWSHDSQYFATSSREGKVVIWSKMKVANDSHSDICSLKDWKALDILELKNESITAVTFAHFRHTNGSYILALGCESGLIHVYQFNGKFTLLVSLDKSQSHHMTVKRLRFRPWSGAKNQFQLASCGEDCLIRVYQLNL